MVIAIATAMSAAIAATVATAAAAVPARVIGGTNARSRRGCAMHRLVILPTLRRLACKVIAITAHIGAFTFTMTIVEIAVIAPIAVIDRTVIAIVITVIGIRTG